MNNQDFISEICKYYKESRELKISDNPYEIWRGVNHSISSKSEDLFALFIAIRLNDSTLEFIVDKTMTYKISGGKSIQFRPDLAIVKNGTLTHSIDLKMDMGYNRRYFETKAFEKQKEKFKLFRNQNFEKVYYTKDDKEIKLKVSSKIINQIVVISEKNGGKSSNKSDMISAISEMDWVDIYYLTGGVHPNNASNELPRLNVEEFDRLIKDIRVLV